MKQRFVTTLKPEVLKKLKMLAVNDDTYINEMIEKLVEEEVERRN